MACPPCSQNEARISERGLEADAARGEDEVPDSELRSFCWARIFSALVEPERMQIEIHHFQFYSQAPRRAQNKTVPSETVEMQFSTTTLFIIHFSLELVSWFGHFCLSLKVQRIRLRSVLTLYTLSMLHPSVEGLRPLAAAP